MPEHRAAGRPITSAGTLPQIGIGDESVGLYVSNRETASGESGCVGRFGTVEERRK
jgi:hypothetical protein